MSGKSSKIEELYLSLSKKDLENITSFLSCTIFNQSEIVLATHLCLSELYPFEKGLDKNVVYRTVFGQREKYSDVKLRVFFTKLVKLIEKYLVIKEIDNLPLLNLNVLTRYYSELKLAKNHSIFFHSEPDFKFRSYEEYLEYVYYFTLKKLNYIYLEQSQDLNQKKKYYELVFKAQRKLNSFQTLDMQCRYLTFTQKFKNEINNSHEVRIVNEMLETFDDQDDVMKAYLLVYLISRDNNIQAFYDLKQLLLNSNIPFEINYKALLSFSETLCIGFINSGKTEFLEHLFEIYKCEIIFFKLEGDIESVNFRNIVYTALQLNQIDWAENFVSNFSKFVKTSDQENTFNFNYARIFFEKGDYKSAMRQLLKVTYEDSFYASTGRILLIKCYYELNDEMPLISCCLSLNQFLNRNKEFTKQRVENNVHFIKYVKMLQKHRLENNKPFFKKLYQKVNSSTVVEKEWLLKKIEEFY